MKQTSGNYFVISKIIHFHTDRTCPFLLCYHFQEKHHHNLEHQRQLQELAFIKEEKRQLGREVEALRSKDKRIREWTNRLEQILHKVKHIYECKTLFDHQKILICYSNILLPDVTFQILIINFKANCNEVLLYHCCP